VVGTLIVKNLISVDAEVRVLAAVSACSGRRQE
jgi:hypothetical protein